MKKQTLSHLSRLILVGLLCGSPCESRAELIFTPVAVNGQPAPGTTSGITFGGSNYKDVQINDAGEVMFIASVSGPGVFNSNRAGIWSGLPGSLQAIVREGDTAPKSAGAPYKDIFKPVLNDSGDILFFARTTPPGASLQSTLAASEGSTFVSWVDSARRYIDKLADQIEETLFGPLPQYQICRDPKYVLYRLKDNSSFVDDLWSEGQRLQRFSLEKLTVKEVMQPEELQSPALGPARSALILSSTNGIVGSIIAGDKAPGTTEEWVSFDQVAQAGRNMAFIATTSSKSGIWYGTTTNLQPTALYDTPLPASLQAVLGPDARWGNIFSGSLGINARGEVAFGASVNAASFLFAGPPEAPRVAVRFVQPDSTGEGFVSAGKMVMNAAGDIAFTGAHTLLREIPGIAGIPGAGVSGLGLTYQHGSPKLVLAEGKTAPGLKDGEVISFFGFGGLFMNRYGQVVMHAEIGGAVGFEHRTDMGIWLIDPVRGPQLVARGGTLVDIGGGQMRPIAEISVSFLSYHDKYLSGGEDGRPKPFNDLGQVVFVAGWKEANGGFGSGVFVAGEVRVLAGRRVGDDIQVAFATALGRKYRVEFRDAVESGAWATLKDNVDGTGGSVIVTDVSVAKLPKRFYRVAALP